MTKGFSSFLAYFSRKTTSGRFIPEIDGLRFICITWVVLFHVSQIYTDLQPMQFSIPPLQDGLGFILQFGLRGVELFFTISGFVLAIPFATYYLKGTKRVSLKDYYIRRITRLEPPYIISLTFIFLYVVFLRGESLAVLLPHYLAGLAYLHEIIYNQHNLISVVAWSLEIEFQFYILAPFISLLFAIRHTPLRRSVIVVTSMVFVALQFLAPLPFDSLLNYIQFFLAGFLLADIFILDWQEKPEHQNRWDAVFLAGWPALIAILASENMLAIRLGLPVITFILYYATFRGNVANHILTIPFLTTIGGMCYTIYLLHYPIITLVLRFTKSLAFTQLYFMNLLLQISIAVPLCLVICGIFFLLIERPCMDKNWPQNLKNFFVKRLFSSPRST